MIRWMGSGHASPDVDGDDVWARLNSAVSERGECRLVGDWQNCRDVVQGKVDFPHEANGYHGVVPTAEVVVSHRDKANKLKKKASAH